MGDSAKMRYATPRLCRIAARLLVHEAGERPATSETLAAASGRLLDRLTQRLTEVIGPAGVEAIFLRAVRLRNPSSHFSMSASFPANAVLALPSLSALACESRSPKPSRRSR